MTDKLILFVSKLEATADPRVKSGLLLPYTEPGMTNLGKVTATKGALRLADQPNPLTLEHVDKLQVADFVAFEETDEGLRCSVRYHESPMGDAALAEFDAGTRTGLSVEVDQPVIRAGKLAAGIVSGGSQVEDPAFPSAKLAAADAPTAPDMGADPVPGDPASAAPKVVIDGAELADVADVTVTDAEIDITTKTKEQPPAVSANKEEPTMAAAATVTSAALAASKVTPKNAPGALQKLYATLAEAAPQGQNRMTAALADIVPADILGIDQGQYVGELWGGNAYTRRIVPLYNHAPLTSFKVKGWEWVTKPEVDDYAGNKTAVPSAEIETQPVEIDAYRLAGAHNIDRKFRDFGDAEFWDAYYRAMSESTSKKSDVKVRTLVAAGSTMVHLLNSQMTAGVPTALNLIVKGVMKIVDSLEVIPDHAMVTTDLYEPILYTKEQDVLAYLNAALGWRDGTLGNFKILPVPAGSLTVDLTTDFVGKVLVGCHDAVTVHELDGEAPIRIEAPNIALGGVDSGVFYYGATNIHSADGLVLYDTPTAS